MLELSLMEELVQVVENTIEVMLDVARPEVSELVMCFYEIEACCINKYTQTNIKYKTYNKMSCKIKVQHNCFQNLFVLRNHLAQGSLNWDSLNYEQKHIFF